MTRKMEAAVAALLTAPDHSDSGPGRGGIGADTLALVAVGGLPEEIPGGQAPGGDPGGGQTTAGHNPGGGYLGGHNGR